MQIRETQLKQELERVDESSRVKAIEDMQHEMNEREKRLWFFENEDNIDLRIEAIEKGRPRVNAKKQRKALKNNEADTTYVPPEVDAKRN